MFSIESISGKFSEKVSLENALSDKVSPGEVSPDEKSFKNLG